MRKCSYCDRESCDRNKETRRTGIEDSLEEESGGITAKLEGSQQDLCGLEEAKRSHYKDRMKRRMEGKFYIKRKGYQQVIEELKKRLTVTNIKIKRYEDRVKQYQRLKTTRRSF